MRNTFERLEIYQELYIPKMESMIFFFIALCRGLKLRVQRLLNVPCCGKYNIRRNVSLDFTVVTMRMVSIIFFELAVVKNLFPSFECAYVSWKQSY